MSLLFRCPSLAQKNRQFAAAADGLRSQVNTAVTSEGHTALFPLFTERGTMEGLTPPRESGTGEFHPISDATLPDACHLACLCAQ